MGRFLFLDRRRPPISRALNRNWLKNRTFFNEFGPRRTTSLLIDGKISRSRHKAHWQEERGVGWHYIAQGKPVQNACVERLNEHVFRGLPMARRIIEAWQLDYKPGWPGQPSA